MIQIRDIKIPVNHNEKAIKDRIRKLLRIEGYDFDVVIVRQSIDARKKPDIYYIYTVNVDFGKNENRIKSYIQNKKLKNCSFEIKKSYELPQNGSLTLNSRPVIVGSGPAGLFCAYILAQKGFCPIVIERGDCVEKRIIKVNKTFSEGSLDTESNVQFGEGGAGTFSDGKLNTLTKDINGRNQYVLDTFARFGAPDEIRFVAKPHIGTDLLCDVVRNMREEIISLGGEFLFNSRMDELYITDGTITSIGVIDNNTGQRQKISSDILVLAIGHSARDTFEVLYEKGIDMQQKSFAVGFRVQHKQSLVNKWQYGLEDPSVIGLSSADYKVTNECGNGRRVYSFCMCPGGYVVNASSENNQICVNGMSESKRDSAFANSAIIVGISPDDFEQNIVDSRHPLSGMYYQRSIESKAYERGRGNICGQYFVDFENNIETRELKNEDLCTKGIVSPGNLRGIFNDEIDNAVIESMHKFGYTREAFDASDVVFYGIEARTSSPVRINRDENYVSNIAGIYPCGEGAGYAGGITSAATDGIKVAEAILSRYNPDCSH